jgi:hypothetical protein
MGRYDILLQKEEIKQSPAVTPSDTPVSVSRSSPQPRSSQTMTERPNGRTPERSNGKRIITRNSFEIYEDQMDDLRERAFEEKRQGKIGSMSAMVRDAIDQYLRRSHK